MAPVSDRFGAGEDGRDRAQLLLVGALSLAIALVAVALVLNSAIYTHNLASRQDTVSDDVVTFTRDVRAGAGGSLDLANRRVGNTGYGPVGTAYTDSVESMEGTVNERSAVDVAATRVSHVGNSQVRGVRLVDRDGGTFLPGNAPTEFDSDTWVVANGTRVRSFRIDAALGASPLVQLDVGQVTDVLQNPDTDDRAFVVEFTDDVASPGSGTTWRVAVSNDTNDDPRLSVLRPDGDVRTCTVASGSASSPVTVDFTGARFGGQACDALSFVDDLPDVYAVKYYNGDEIEGSYELFVDLPIESEGSEAGVVTDSVDHLNYGEHCDGPTYHDPRSGEYPRVVPAYYATDLDLRYQGPDVEFAGTQRVAPGEAGPAPVSPRITSLTVTEVGNGDDADFDVTVNVTDPNGDLASVSVEVDSPSDGADTSTQNIPGDLSEATVTVTGQDGNDDNDDFEDVVTVTVTVTDDESHSRSVTQTHRVDNNADSSDGTGCAP